jgi:hypothetical protein
MLCLSTHVAAKTFGNIFVFHCLLCHLAREKELKIFLRFFFTLFKCSTLIMAMKWECLHLNKKFEVMYLCEVKEQIRMMARTDLFNTLHWSEEE